MIEYQMERSADCLTLRRTRAWNTRSAFGALGPLAAAAWVGYTIRTSPIDVLSLILSVTTLTLMLFVFYQLALRGRSIAFDKQRNIVLMDGRSVCALSNLTSVQMEGTQRDFRSPESGRLRGVVFRRTHGKPITLKYAWEGTMAYARLAEMAPVIADFVGVPYNII